jgi:hypothetical protein
MVCEKRLPKAATHDASEGQDRLSEIEKAVWGGAWSA